jgi:tRNA (guanine-N7-)-methyltransferase
MPTSTSAAESQRRVRSYVRRAGRITTAQARALEELWPKFGIDFSPERIDLDQVFGRSARRLLEIGFGNGEALCAIAARRPEWDCLGIEVHEPGVGRVLLQAASSGLVNLRVIRHDAVEVLSHQLADDTFDEIFIYFPDPWPKKRHHKRRLVQAPFAQLLTAKLRPGAILRLATDWQPYAEQMREVLDACDGLTNCGGESGYAPRPAIRPPTRFERRGQRLGHGVWDLEYRKAVPGTVA